MAYIRRIEATMDTLSRPSMELGLSKSNFRITIDIFGSEPDSEYLYLSGDRIDGCANISVTKSTMFDKVEILLQGKCSVRRNRNETNME